MIYDTTTEINYPLDGSLDTCISEMMGYDYFLVVTSKPARNNKQGWAAAYIVPCNVVARNN